MTSDDLHEAIFRAFDRFDPYLYSFYLPKAPRRRPSSGPEPKEYAAPFMCEEGAEPDTLERWFSEDTDVRADSTIGHDILNFIEARGVKSVVMADRIIGCPHEGAEDKAAIADVNDQAFRRPNESRLVEPDGTALHLAFPCVRPICTEQTVVVQRQFRFAKSVSASRVLAKCKA